MLLLVFGALVAAGLPLLLALSAVAGTMGLLALPSQLVPMGEAVKTVLLLMGLAVGVDYSLFYLKREREERAASKARAPRLRRLPPPPAARADLGRDGDDRDGRPLLLTGDAMSLSLGVATMMVVAAAMLAR